MEIRPRLSTLVRANPSEKARTADFEELGLLPARDDEPTENAPRSSAHAAGKTTEKEHW